jgi:photosystem II stability/assembly factor-like uncharacterized protein
MTLRRYLRSAAVGAACLAALAAAFAVAPAALHGMHHTPPAAVPPGSWTLVFEHPIAGKYEGIAFPDAKHGWVVNARGEILNSMDGGVTWTVQATGLGSLRSVNFIDAKRGFAGTVAGKLYATTNGGTTWTDITSTLPHVPRGFCGMTHVGDRMHIVGRYTGGATDYFFSPDAGKTWRYSDLGALAQGLVDVSFLSNDVGFIGGMAKSDLPNRGSAIILKTTDGGKNWHPVFQHDGGRGYAWKLWPISAKLIYASLQSEDGIYRIVKSMDAGDHWDTLTVATERPKGPGVQGIGFLDENTGWVGGFFRGMWATTDGGHTWTQTQTTDGTINRFARAGGTIFTASTRGVLRYDAHPAHP